MKSFAQSFYQNLASFSSEFWLCGELPMALAEQGLSCLPHGCSPAVPKDEAVWRQSPSVSGLWHLGGGRPTGLGQASWPFGLPHVCWKPFFRRKSQQRRSPSGQIIPVQGQQMQLGVWGNEQMNKWLGFKTGFQQNCDCPLRNKIGTVQRSNGGWLG